MSRFARTHRVFYFEEPVFEQQAPCLRVSRCLETQVQVCTPVLSPGLSASAIVQQQRELLDAFLLENGVIDFLAWYYTPMAREFSRHLRPAIIVYDCMDELSAFAGAPPDLPLNERELFEAAALVFTGGASLFEAKRKQHSCAYLYPSSVDAAHFAAARSALSEPGDQTAIPYPRIGYAGVIDERMDLELLAGLARMRPGWQFVLLGPVVKIDPNTLPQAPNIHYLGIRPYAYLPAYFSGWRIGMLPFSVNESTRYISPTKTPEYLAAGLHVISTPIRDVVKPYGELGLAGIAKTADEFVSLAEELLTARPNEPHLQRVDAYLALNSWEKTWVAMSSHISEVMNKNLVAEKQEAAFLTHAVPAEDAARV